MREAQFWSRKLAMHLIIMRTWLCSGLVRLIGHWNRAVADQIFNTDLDSLIFLPPCHTLASFFLNQAPSCQSMKAS